MIRKNLVIFLPILISVILSSSYLFFVPNNIKGDAIEYDGLANSILKGEYSLDGIKSMEREPGYPLYRAIIKSFTQNLFVILIIQVILFCGTIYIVGLVCKEIDPERWLWGYFGASLSYGLAFYASTHISEILTGFLLSLVGLFLIRGIKEPKTKYWFYVSFFCSLLILTRYPYALILPVSLFMLAKTGLKHKINKKVILRNSLIYFFVATIIISPWLMRNYNAFGEVNIAGRSGAGLYARAWKAEKSWRSLGDSYVSAIVGRAILFKFYKSNESIWLEQWGDWWRNPEIAKLRGETPTERDKKNKQLAKEIIFNNFDNFSKFVVWTGVDTLRFLQLPNPAPQAFGSPFEGTYGELGKTNQISNLQLLALGLVHFIQIIWFTLISLSIYLGFKKYKMNFLPGIFFASLFVVHAIADNTARYSTPLEPWLLSAIFMIIFYPLYTRLKKQN